MADSLETETIYLAIENLLTNVSKLQDLAQLACASVDARAIRECDRFRYVGLHQVRLGCHISPVPIKDAEKQFIEAFMQTVLGLSETVMACVRHAQTADPSGPQPPIDSMLYDWTTGANEDVCAASKRLKEVADGARGPNISLFARKEKDPAKPERSADKGTIEEETMEDVEILDDGEISDDSWSVISDPVTTAEEDFEQLEIVKALVPDIAEEIEKSERERKEQEAEEKMAKMELDVQTETIPDLINKLRDRSALLAEFLPILKAYVPPSFQDLNR